MSESKKQFAEAFEELTGWELEDYPDQAYADTCWEFWRMSREAIEFKLPDQEKYEYWIGPKGEEEFDLVNFISDLSEAIRAAGIKVKE